MGSVPVRWRRLDSWIVAGWAFAFALMPAGRIQDTDPYWQVRAGQEWLDGTPLARPDSWSWAPVDGLFYPNSPAWNVILALTWRAAGAWGMFVLTVLFICMYFGLTIYLALRLGAHRLAIAIAIIVVSLGALPMLSPRAGVPSEVLLLAAIAGAIAWSDRVSRQPTAASMALLAGFGFAISACGNWVHLSWSTTAVGVAVAWAVIWALTPGISPRQRVLLVAAGTLGLVAGIAVGPYGSSVYERTQKVVEACRGLILEWVGAFHPDAAGQWALPTLLAISLSVVMGAWLWRMWRRRSLGDPRVRVAAALLVFAAPSSLAGLIAIRFTGVGLLTLLPILAMMVTLTGRSLHQAAQSRYGGASRWAEYTSDRFWRVILGSTLVVVVPFVLLYAAPHAQPVSAGITKLLPEGCRLFSPPKDSAEVILLRPDVTVWFDGRADYWGRQRITAFYSYLARNTGTELVPPGTTCVVLPDPAAIPTVGNLAAALDESPDWRRAAQNGEVILWLPMQ